MTVQEFPDTQSLASEAARGFIAAVPSCADFLVALSGGRIAKSFYSAIADQIRTTRKSLERVHFFFADERCVPPNDPECNYFTAWQFLFEPLKIRADQIHRIHGETDDTYAAQEAEAELCRIATLDANGQPILDLAILGMGEDGHTASLFPGEPGDIASQPAVYRAVTAPKPPPLRITMGYAALQAARAIWVLASGPGKEPALREILSPKNSRLPLRRVLEGHPNTLIYSDISGSAQFERNF